MALRLVLYTQMALVAFTGAYGRGLLPGSESGSTERTMASTVPIVLYGFPILVFLVARRARLSEGRAWLIGLVEAALIFAYVLAVLPAVQ
jgi:hypothetical protein